MLKRLLKRLNKVFHFHKWKEYIVKGTGTSYRVCSKCGKTQVWLEMEGPGSDWCMSDECRTNDWVLSYVHDLKKCYNRGKNKDRVGF